MAIRFAAIGAVFALASTGAIAAPQPIMKPATPSVVPIPIASPLRAAEPTASTQATPASASVAAVVAGEPATVTGMETTEAGVSKPVRIYWFLSGR